MAIIRKDWSVSIYLVQPTICKLLVFIIVLKDLDKSRVSLLQSILRFASTRLRVPVKELEHGHLSGAAHVFRGAPFLVTRADLDSSPHSAGHSAVCFCPAEGPRGDHSEGAERGHLPGAAHHLRGSRGGGAHRASAAGRLQAAVLRV